MPRKTAGSGHRAADPVPQASMRPRPDAAENWRRYHVVSLLMTGFNEAAARCRGKLPLRCIPGRSSSMLQ